MVKAPWRKRKLENYEFSGNSLEGGKALLYMRQVGGLIGFMAVIFLQTMFFFFFTIKTKC